MNLKAWLVLHLKQKDIFFNKIKNIDDSKVTYKDKTLSLKTSDKLSDLVGDLEDTLIAVPNTKENIDWLISNWNNYSKQKNLGIFFVAGNKKWVIYPYTHNKIIDKKNLRQGIITLSENLS